MIIFTYTNERIIIENKMSNQIKHSKNSSKCISNVVIVFKVSILIISTISNKKKRSLNIDKFYTSSLAQFTRCVDKVYKTI